MDQKEVINQLTPIWAAVRPFVEKRASDAAATRTANLLNRRRRKRLQLPEPVPEGCPPVDFNPADCPEKTRVAVLPLVAAGGLSLAIGAALGFFFGRQKPPA